MRKRLLIALAVGSAVFAGAYAMAASLPVSSTRLGAGDAVVPSCDTDGVTTSYTVSYSATGTAGYKIDTAEISGVAATCLGATMKVTLTGASNSALAERTQVVAAPTSYSINFSSSAVPAAEVTGVHVTIVGP
jgi:hypothetical protein